MIYRGRVLGVGFRYVTRQLADRFSVTGSVQDLHDGSVRLLVEGDSHELDRFLMAIDRAMKDYIASREATVLAYQGDFDDFTIRSTGEGGD